MSHRVVDEGRPEEREDEERAELHALGERADDEGRRDDREHHLEEHEQQVRDGGRVVGVGLDAHAVEAGPAQAADEAAVVGAEGQAVAEQHPLDADDAQQDEALHHDGEHVLAAHQAAVEEGQPRRHQHDQRRADQHPGGIASI